MAAKAGYDGLYKGEFWVPVQVELSNTGPEIVGTVQIAVGSSAGGDRVVYSAPVSLPTQSNKRLTLYAYLPNIRSDLTVELVDERDRLIGAVETNALDRLNVDDLLYGVVSDRPGELDMLEGVTGDRREAAVAFLDPADLPEAAAAWNALDVLVFHDVDSGQLTPGQLRALRGWLDLGGQLVVTGGPSWQKTTAALADLLPVAVTGAQTVADLPGLSAQAGQPFRDPGPYLVTSGSLRSGQVLFHEEGLPLLARQRHGRGAAYFLALDPALAPLADWEGSKSLWSEIAAFTPSLPAWAMGAQNGFAASSAVTTLPSLSLPSVLQLLFFLFVYIIVVGPLNYMLLSRMKRRELAWLTIPGLVVIFSAIALIMGFQLKGNVTIMNQMSVAYGATDGEQMRLQTLLGLYSPRRETYDIQLPAGTMARPFDRSFGALAGGGTIDSVERSGHVTLSEVRVDVSDVQTFVAESYGPTPPIAGQAELQLKDGYIELDVSVQNNGDVGLENVVVLLGFTAIPLGDLEPGEILSANERISSGQATTAAGPGGIGTLGATVGPATSPLSLHMPTILGSSNYFNDPDVFPRWQLLQAITPEFRGDDGHYPLGTVTLIAWSDEGQLDVDLADSDFDSLATTLYFLELPLTQSLVSGRGVTLDGALLSWRIVDESGVFNPAVSDFYLPTGWIEYEFQPWPEFQAMAVTDLAVSLLAPSHASSQPLPNMQLWDWNQERWLDVADAGWGRTEIVDPAPFVGPGNSVRIRLENASQRGIEILDIHPQLTGNLE
jgi:hypothetical protein